MANNIVERGKAKAEILQGAIQEGIGHAIGNEKMEAAGAAHKVVGKARDDAAKLAERTKGQVEEAVGKIKTKAGEALDSVPLKIDGKIDELTGKARQELNK